MIDPSLDDFFSERKAGWLKKNISTSMSDIEIKEKEIECESVFSPPQWLPNAAKRAGQISISTHPCTFSHPSSRKNKNGYASSIIVKKEPTNDGFLRSGNVSVEADALGNAAALDVYKFLTLTMQDGKKLLQHIEQDTGLAISLLTIPNPTEEQTYQYLKQGFLAMTNNAEEVVTSSKIKQVYFPINEGPSSDLNKVQYHQLSILTASGILFELRKRLDSMRFGEEIKQARDKKKNNQEYEGFREIYNLTTIGYGGTKPQNISVLNNQNGGKAHLFMCVPPKLLNRDIHFPKADFFNQTVHYFQCKGQFQQLHKLYKRDDNNVDIRNLRDDYYQSVIDHLIEKMWQVRGVSDSQYIEASNQLSSAQKIWLCENENSKLLRETSEDWLDSIVKSVTGFLFHGYEKVLGNKAIKLGDEEHNHMKKIVLTNREALR